MHRNHDRNAYRKNISFTMEILHNNSLINFYQIINQNFVLVSNIHCKINTKLYFPSLKMYRADDLDEIAWICYYHINV